jgi:hypothetical protein
MADVRLTSNVSRQPASEISAAGAISPSVPALLKAISSPPKDVTASSVRAGGMRSSAMSPAKATASPPSSAISAMRRSSSEARRAVTTSFAPSRAKSFAAARPMPELAPVMIAVFPSRMRICFSIST